MNIIAGLGELASGSIRNLARNLFSGFYEREISANQALQELRAAGLGYRRQDFLADFRQGKGEFDQATSIRYVSPLNTPSEKILEPKYFGVPDKYSMVFKVSYTTEEGTSDNQYFFYHRNSLDSRANMENDAYDYIVSTENDSGVEGAYTIQIVEGYINPMWA